MANLVGASGRNGFGQDEAPRLTPREREVLRLIAEGVRASQIAEKLHITARLVGALRRDIMRKLGLRTIAELTRYAIHEGLVER
jgi:two-component system secretion response regulator SsrB